MKNIWLSGVMAAGLALLAVAMLSSAPVLRTAAAAAKVHTEYAEPVPEQEPERRIQSFVVHQAAQHRHDEGIPLTVRIDGADRQMTLSEYLCGVLLGEMPADFPTEALKAQAVAARTYTMHTLESGVALSDDPSTCQAYRDPSEAPERLEKIRQAVLETDGEVAITGEDGRRTIELITAIYKAGSTRQTVALPIAPDDPFYTVDGIRQAVPHFYEKTASVGEQEGDLSFGNFRKGEK